MTALRQPWSILERGGRAGIAALAFFALASVCGCSKYEPPPRLPSTAIHDRAASRVELVDFVIPDHARAQKVRALYEEIERLMRQAQTVQVRELAKLGAGPFHSDDELYQSVANSREAELLALERYVHVELEIRALTTPQEFARLDAIR